MGAVFDQVWEIVAVCVSPGAIDRGDPSYLPPGENDDPPVIVGYLVRPFDEALAKTTIDDEHKIIWATACGGDPVAATESIGIPYWCSGLVAHDVLSRFLSRMRAIKLDLAKRTTEAA